MSTKAVERIQKHLRNSNYDWPRDHFTRSEKVVSWLEHRLARVVSDDDIEFATSTVVDGRDGSVAKYTATILTKDFVIHGHMEAPDAAQQFTPYPQPGDVTIVHRSNIQSLTLHHVEESGDDEIPDYVSFTAVFTGLPPVHVGLPRYSAQMDGSTSGIFDSLTRDLGRAAT
ncbi:MULTISPECIES: hypothetical protein [Paenarthrobacter]|uniref:hypothetical protein n=1 Tax=Paenarthrobacter TaxID=1742992 RepID=UPI00084EC563|nr:hypothetical protein [Paenarthrobacter ureafaciens]NKR11235.1 hypothetical protein [Arthrobacter sp. M5]NKR18040.1 hypothetical protein [Arthrobacter sp. M6]OEH58371.1 hypothetical protein A5N17_01725 [Arthrobacter sp. D2]OEH62039.1 hypothetical protein A5N13_15240 [Arthrobacter sp. D4]QMU82124.1 hypothetical protein FV140_08250 [Paenarthrobacter ureafaciens]